MKLDITGKGMKCVKCGESAHANYIIDNRGFGSDFDCITESTTIPVCCKCDHMYLKQEWFDEQPSIAQDTGFETYQHEGEIMKFINSLNDDLAEKVLTGHYR